MVYSVFNKQTQAYDYYDAPVPRSDAPPDPTHLRNKELGVPVTSAGWPLPAGSKWIGRGEVAKGRIATPFGDDGGSSMGWLKWAALAAGAYLIWRAR